MPTIFKLSDMAFTPRKSDLPDFLWDSSERLSQIAKSGRLVFDIRSLSPKKFSFPFHFHHHAEELFYIISGECTLRTNNKFERLTAGALVHFEAGPSSAHQVYNHSDAPCVYLDIRTFSGMDVAEYPDSGKIAVLASEVEVFHKDKRAAYYDGEENVRAHWPKELL